MATIRDRYILEIDTTGGVRNINNAATASGRLSTSLGGIRNVAGLAAGALAVIGGANLVGNVIETTAAYEDLRDALTTVTGSAENAQQAFDFIQDFATTTPFQVDELSEAFIKLQNAGIEPTREFLNVLGDAASVTSDASDSFAALSDVFSRGFQGGLGIEELQRLQDRGINVYGILREELGLSRLEISEFGKTAEGAQEILAALQRGLAEEYGGAMAERMDNLSTSLSNMRIAATNALLQVGENGLAQGVQYAAEAITGLLNESDGLLQMLGQGLGEAIRVATDLFMGLVEAFQEGGPQVELLTTVFDSVVQVVGALFDAIGPVAEALQPLAELIANILVPALEFAADALTILIEGFTSFVTGISEAITNAESFSEAVTGAFTAIYNVVTTTVSE